MPPEPRAALLDSYGIRRPEDRAVASPEDAGAAARELGGPVALKALAPDLLHKTDVGAVVLGLSGREEVEREARRMSAALTDAGHPPSGFVVQRMVTGGVEMLVGVVHDPVFGPVLACGAGGTAAELLKDVAVRITPVTDRGVAEMIRSLTTFPLLDGYRGVPKADVAALEELLLRVGAMVEAHPEVAEMDLNPVLVLERGAVAVDARIRIEPATPPPPISARGD
jgi:acyl-CoA synthetase (NDP forming)